jgi:iron(III) transport system substrate-binding protein
VAPRNGKSLRGVTPLRRVAALTVLSLFAVACGGDERASSSGDGNASNVDADVQAAFDEVADQMTGVDVDLVQAAKDEGSVAFYGITNAAITELSRKFQEDFPFISVENIQLAGGALNERFASEQEAGLSQADVFAASGDSSVRDFADRGFCEKYTPATAAAYPETSKGVGGDSWYRWGGSAQGLAYVDGELDDDDLAALETWQGITDERFSDVNWGWVDVAAGGTTIFNNTYFFLEYEDKLWREHADVVAGVNIYGGTNPSTAALLQGEVEIAGPLGISGPTEAALQGAPIAWIVPTPTLGVPSGGCMANNPANPNAAALLWEYILSDRGQSLIIPFGQVSYKNDLPEVDPPDELASKEWYSPPNQDEIVELSSEDIATNRDEVISAWREVFGAP